jgi:hypothetical protein
MEKDRDEPAPAPVTVSRILPNGEVESFRIEHPPARFRIDWTNRTAVPVETTGKRWLRRPAAR